MTRPTAKEVRDEHFGVLKPCPFCGEKAAFVECNDRRNIGGWYVECSNRQCRVSTGEEGN